MELEIFLYSALGFCLVCLVIALLLLGIRKPAYRKAIENLAKTKVDWCHESLYCEDCKKKEDCRIWEAIQRGQ